MKYSFNCYGHENVTAKHKTTLEFTKDRNVGLNGDCIVGVRSDFSLDRIREFVTRITKPRIEVQIEVNDLIENFEGILNPNFNSENEIVARKTDFVSERTLLTNTNKAAKELSCGFVDALRIKNNRIKVTISYKLN